MEKYREFARVGGQTIDDEIMVSKGITLFAQTATFNVDIRKWRQQTTNLKKWSTFKTFYHQTHQEQSRVVTTTSKGAVINKIEISNPKISLMKFIGKPPNFSGENTLELADSGANIHL